MPPLSLSRDLSLSGDFLSHHRTLDPAPAPNSAATVLYLFFGLRLFYIAWRSSDSKSSQKKEIEEVLSTGLGRIVPNLISRKHTNSAATCKATNYFCYLTTKKFYENRISIFLFWL
ncbi:uncharacterized protein LOC126625660 isoform X1 [Malus sylvestris]|uniref:uncharacterized protein LOC126625660 isoform X1 n=1 Tax=Malus sylvestris TaxID=3752 RepID=UPI0021ABBE4E|nr:uncharacterized protein LOC126625660 isoform X1 [Malus sylvestris]